MLGHSLTELQWRDFLSYTVRQGELLKYANRVGLGRNFRKLKNGKLSLKKLDFCVGKRKKVEKFC